MTITRWHAYLYLGKGKKGVAVVSSPYREKAIAMIMQYAGTYLSTETDTVRVVIKPVELKGENQ